MILPDWFPEWLEAELTPKEKDSYAWIIWGGSIVEKDIRKIPEMVYHVSPFPELIMVEGLKTAKELGKAAFGGHGDYISVTDWDTALIYYDNMLMAIEIVNGRATDKQVEEWLVDRTGSERAWGIALETVKTWKLSPAKAQWEAFRTAYHYADDQSRLVLFFDYPTALVGRTKEDIGIVEARVLSDIRFRHMINTPEDMTPYYTYNHYENEWRIYNPKKLEPIKIHRPEAAMGVEKIYQARSTISKGKESSIMVTPAELCSMSTDDLSTFVEKQKTDIEAMMPESTARWWIRYVEGISNFIARGPEGEPSEETRREGLIVAAIMLESTVKAKDKAKAWVEGWQQGVTRKAEEVRRAMEAVGKVLSPPDKTMGKQPTTLITRSFIESALSWISKPATPTEIEEIFKEWGNKTYSGYPYQAESALVTALNNLRGRDETDGTRPVQKIIDDITDEIESAERNVTLYERTKSLEFKRGVEQRYMRALGLWDSLTEDEKKKYPSLAERFDKLYTWLGYRTDGTPLWEIQFKTPIARYDDLVEKYRAMGIDVGTDAYYEDPRRFVTVIVRVPKPREAILTTILDEIKRTATGFGGVPIYEGPLGKSAGRNQVSVYSLRREREILEQLKEGDMTFIDLKSALGVLDDEVSAFAKVISRLIKEGKIYPRSIGPGLPVYYSLTRPHERSAGKDIVYKNYDVMKFIMDTEKEEGLHLTPTDLTELYHYAHDNRWADELEAHQFAIIIRLWAEKKWNPDWHPNMLRTVPQPSPKDGDSQPATFKAFSGDQEVEVVLPKDQLIAVLHQGMDYPLEEFDSPKVLDYNLSIDAQELMERLFQDIDIKPRVTTAIEAGIVERRIDSWNLEAERAILRGDVMAKDGLLGVVKFDRIEGVGEIVLGKEILSATDIKELVTKEGGVYTHKKHSVLVTWYDPTIVHIDVYRLGKWEEEDAIEKWMANVENAKLIVVERVYTDEDEKRFIEKWAGRTNSKDSPIIYERIFSKLVKVVPLEMITGKVMAGKSVSPGFMDLNYDFLRVEEGNRYIIALSHYYKHPSGDMIPDPDMEIAVMPDMKMAEALTYQDSFGYRAVYPEPGKVDVRAKKEMNDFLLQWLTNLIDQGHKIKSTEGGI